MLYRSLPLCCLLLVLACAPARAASDDVPAWLQQAAAAAAPTYAKDVADAGAVFGYQAITEERALFPHDEWSFQKELAEVKEAACLPALVSRYTLSLPAGWTATAVTFNHVKIDPAVTGSTYTWELK